MACNKLVRVKKFELTVALNVLLNCWDFIKGSIMRGWREQGASGSGSWLWLLLLKSGDYLKDVSSEIYGPEIIW